MINLYQLPKLEGKNYSMSPFCIKLELYLKVAGLAYQNHFGLEFNKSPTGKMPYIQIKGKKYADSNLIISRLEQENNFFIDEHLDSQQKAIALSFIRLCEDSLYWAGLYSRWIDTDNKIWKINFIEASGLPKIMASIIYPVVKRNILRQLRSIGLMSLTKSEIYSKAEKDISAIANFLEVRKYFFNDKVSLLDLTVFSFLVTIGDGTCSKRLQSFVCSKNLGSFIENIQNKYLAT
ncbi:glutathione S-transferase family protein [Allofrancisella guangzhouensis]|uniref:Glutathione S-transferase n=1 Tax=Allofrancisella guangzhouensis TaxID=594679 RepID=A0A0A8E3R8_9GAMM|nr:glutathione S-transferase family protein [Allofrancisella guangzhouensis]AJC48880.1 glutathione S-transferase [Allofrancisella guangzhouensis]MBK2027421.1 glutathione S-transferase family protein [Allofrancisella guangzhouensis]MBK2043407.1 glutathione S-transferase family protein [Allofrancisella guangzhouensis]MBK2045832.1 glutathione S-transferase family protein [Allofrancisella guangzhouensis]